MSESDTPANVAVAHEDDVHLMNFPQGRIDGNGVREMYEQCVALAEGTSSRILVDLSGVDKVTSGAMGMLVTMKKRCLGTGAQLHIAAPDDMVMDSFKLMRLDLVLNLFPTVQSALAVFKG